MLSLELEEERDRLLATLAWGAAAVVLGCFTLAFVAVFVTVLFFAPPFWPFWRMKLIEYSSSGFGVHPAFRLTLQSFVAEKSRRPPFSIVVGLKFDDSSQPSIFCQRGAHG